MFGIHEARAERVLFFEIVILFGVILLSTGIMIGFQISLPAVLCIEASVMVAGALNITNTVFYLKCQEKRLEEAAFQVNSFLNGNTDIRLASCEEGFMAKFFEEINHMAMSFHIHLEKEKDAKEFLKNLISDISHQLKTPIAAIRMYNEIIAYEKDNPVTVADFTIKTEKSLDRMECLIQNLLKIAKLDAGTIVLEKKTFYVGTLLEEIAEEYQTEALQGGKKVLVTQAEQEVMLYADRNWTAECIRNLIHNALSHMKKGQEVVLTYSPTPVFVRIAVKDNGDGIHPEDIHHIFKRFYRSRFSQDTQGVGLGLSLVKAIAEAHGGCVSVESVLGQGSSFYLDYPVKRCDS